MSTRIVIAAVVVIAVSNALGQTVDFNRDVRPILAENCVGCHGPDANRRKAKLRLDTRDNATAKRANGGAAIVPGKPDASVLIHRIETADLDERMPPAKTGKTLTAGQRQILRRWIEQGGEYAAHWAFVSPRRSSPPDVRQATWARHEIDSFILHRQESAGIEPAPQADRLTLLRRVSFDLTGLPPTPAEVDAFIADTRGDAYERAVDRLLASPHFGEKWARWWLDLAHYADSDGYLTDQLRPWAWRYRQWVIDALNRDMPFDQFTIDQLAGDLLPDATTEQRVATGFLRNTLSNREGGADLEEFRVRQVVDRTTMVGTIWLGLTVGCAECHDHKYDPITQREFYQLYAFFNDADEVNIDAPLPGEQQRYDAARPQYERQRAELLSPLAGAIDPLQQAWEQKLLWTEANPGQDHRWDRALEVLGLIWGGGRGEGQLEGLMIVKTKRDQRTPSQSERLLDYFLKQGEIIDPAKFKELKLGELPGKLESLRSTLPPLSRAPAMARSPVPRPPHIHIRGDFRQRGERVSSATPAVLPPLESSSPDRLALAKWLVSPKHPLTARVTVNRLWQELFGRGLAPTADNFGMRGQSPSHPELLDWLALEFAEKGWSLKRTLRLIVTSAAYRQSSHARPQVQATDAANALVARQARLRLSAEAVRDATLAASGLLHRAIGGPSVRPPQPESVTKEGFENTWPVSAGPDRYRRGIYTFIQRTSPFAQFVTFDFPDTSRSCTRRERSNTPLQALNLLNDPVFVDAARALAARVLGESKADSAARLRQAFLLALSRPPGERESARLRLFLDEQTRQFKQDADAARLLIGSMKFPADVESGETAAWVALASVLLNLDEFITRE